MENTRCISQIQRNIELALSKIMDEVKNFLKNVQNLIYISIYFVHNIIF